MWLYRAVLQSVCTGGKLPGMLPHVVIWLCCAGCLVAAVAGVSFAWTVVISCMRGALDSMQQSAPTTAQIEEAVAQVAAAAAVTTTALAEPMPASTSITAASPAEPSVRAAAAAAAAGHGAAAVAAAHSPVLAAADVPHVRAHARTAGLKALVPRPHTAAEATG